MGLLEILQHIFKCNLQILSDQVEKANDGKHVHFFAAIDPDHFSPALFVVAENGSVKLDTVDLPTSVDFDLHS